jgi:hypothetical protein
MELEKERAKVQQLEDKEKLLAMREHNRARKVALKEKRVRSSLLLSAPLRGVLKVRVMCSG